MMIGYGMIGYKLCRNKTEHCELWLRKETTILKLTTALPSSGRDSNSEHSGASPYQVMEVVFIEMVK